MVSRRVRFFVSWRRAGLGLRFAVITLGVLLFVALAYLRRPDEDAAATGSSLLVFTLVNLNIVVLCILAFLIGRNIVKLVFDRRKGILGAQLRTRLVVAFVGLTLIPIIILFVLASGLLSRAMEGWFSTQVEASVHGAVDVARQHLAWLKEYSKDVGASLAAALENDPNLRAAPNLRDYLEGKRKDWRLYSIRIFDSDGSEAITAQNAAAVIDTFREPELNSTRFKNALAGRNQALFEEREANQFVRAYVPIRYSSGTKEVLVVTIRATPELTQTLAQVNDSFRQYKQLKLYAAPLKSGYILTLSMITGLLLFSAIWIAFYISRELVVPIQRLAEATRSVAKGRYDVQIREVGGDELSLLVRSFNQMTNDLKSSRRENERRRMLLETILSNLAVGVIALDRETRVTLLNAVAAHLCMLSDASVTVGKRLADLLAPELYSEIKPLLESVIELEQHTANDTALYERDLVLRAHGQELKIVGTAGIIQGEGKHPQGYVLILDDVTELSKAQHMAAWREVAQRIAHEIKNPLTPIQLSAQRLSKLVSEEEDGPFAALDQSSREKVIDCAGTIVENVASIKRLANEFSHFARMPRAEFKEADLNGLITATLEPYAEAHADITFQFISDRALPPVALDSEQIRRVLINLIDNAISALRSAPAAGRTGAHVTVRSLWDNRKRTISFEVSDNGPGVESHAKSKIFEPYFTTKEGGTGLGLAIVTSIVADHQGEVRVYDNKPHGARFVIELPLGQKRVTQRRFAS